MEEIIFLIYLVHNPFLIIFLCILKMIILRRLRRYIIKNSCLNTMLYGIQGLYGSYRLYIDDKNTGPRIKCYDALTYCEFYRDSLHGIYFVIENYKLPTYKIRKYATYRRGILHGKCIVFPEDQQNYNYIYAEYVSGYTTFIKSITIHRNTIYNRPNRPNRPNRQCKKIISVVYPITTYFNICRGEFYKIFKLDNIKDTITETYIVDNVEPYVIYTKKHTDKMIYNVYENNKLRDSQNHINNVVIGYTRADDMITECYYVTAKLQIINDDYVEQMVAQYICDRNKIKAKIYTLPTLSEFKTYKFENNNWNYINIGTETHII